MTEKFTEKEEELRDFILERQTESSRQPTYREMASRFGCNLKTIGDRLAAMEKKGIIKRTGKSRSIVILQDRGTPDRTRLSEPTFNPDLYFRKTLLSLEAYDFLINWARKMGANQDIPIPVPVEFIAKDVFGYEIRKDYFGNDVTGELFDNEKLIVVNIEDSPQRQRFTIAHELAHLYLHNSEALESDSEVKEWEADCFASYLLMPVKPFIRFIEKLLSEAEFVQESDLINKVSKEFNVSRQAARIRLSETPLSASKEKRLEFSYKS